MTSTQSNIATRWTRTGDIWKLGLNGSAVGGARRWGRAGQSWWGSLLGPAA